MHDIAIEFEQDRRHHRRDRRHCVPDQHSRAERGGRSGARRRDRAAASRWSRAKCAASRSAAPAAAKEIKELIGDSVDKVQSGSALVGRAGTTMDEIVQAVRRVTDIMGEISAASEEQRGGIEQVNRAVAQMDEVTQQNAALVEEAAAAAASLEEQTRQLQDVVERLESGRRRRRAAARRQRVRGLRRVQRSGKSQQAAQTAAARMLMNAAQPAANVGSAHRAGFGHARCRRCTRRTGAQAEDGPRGIRIRSTPGRYKRGHGRLGRGLGNVLGSGTKTCSHSASRSDEGRIIEARLHGVSRADCVLAELAGGRDPANTIPFARQALDGKRDGSYRRQELR